MFHSRGFLHPSFLSPLSFCDIWETLALPYQQVTILYHVLIISSVTPL